MAQLLAYLFTITLSHLATLLRWLGINQPQETWPPDIEADSALNERTSMDLAAYYPLPSSVPSDFSISDGSDEDFPNFRDQPPHVHHARHTIGEQHYFLVDVPNLYWTQHTITSWAHNIPSDASNYCWIEATREEYYRALCQRQSLAAWIWMHYDELPPCMETKGTPALGPMGRYRRTVGTSGHVWTHVSMMGLSTWLHHQAMIAPPA